VHLIHDMPDDAVVAFSCDERTAVITVTHDPKLDDLALMEALKCPAFYVGALGSSITTSKRKSRLQQFDVSAEQVARLKGPVGLPIGSRTPAEIAVSIAAELIQVRSLIGSPDWRSERPHWVPATVASSTSCLLD
jgi:xanthine dehydrogenase accessory factor